ncbi:serine protease snake-like [Zootermopsis nevadensis]|uniref:Serine protease snake n=1 Tax=Zootermopsis nevadensis TaxID=136037 RepID=A0A067RX29_ZOONE|nr:serine protease snake-like [Zootermopsis nevadensis]KDR24454.1 Serine protease snake [Zootermopsis nevadensis]
MNPNAMRRNFIIIVTCFLVPRVDIVAAQKTEGDLCLLKNGNVGICQQLTQCVTAVHKALQGDRPIVCSIKADMPIVCCGEAIQNVIQRPKPSQFTNERYFLDTVTYENYPIRYPRQDDHEPWWIVEKPFVEAPVAPQKPQFSNNNNGNNNHKPSRPNSGTLHSPWWIAERPFTSASLPPPPPPPPTKQTLKPTTQPSPLNIRRPTQKMSEIKCNEYSRPVTSTIAALPLVPAPEPIHVEIPKCDFTSVQLIVGGEETKLKEFPHMAALGYYENGNIDWKCGGSLISKYFVLTAAHCAPRNNPPTIARLGDLNLKLSNEGAKPVNYLVVNIIRHPDYKPPAKYNDIALLKLDRPVEFNEFIRPACLYTRDTFDINKTVATGWGQIDFAEKKSDVLLKVGISIIDNKLCNELYKMDETTKKLGNGIVPSMMCAGELEGGKDTCQGDSGGPIQITRPNNRCVYNIIGITSFGKFCAAKNAPGVYTRVSSYVPWIENIVWPEE